MLVVYAILAPPSRPIRRRGASGEPITIVRCGTLHVALGEVSAVPPVTAPALRAHDAVVRRLAGDSAAILPTRFGTVVADAAELRSRLTSLAPALREALTTVRGREQMTLRVFAARDRRPAAGDRRPAAGDRPATEAESGTAYLARARSRTNVPELAPLRDAVAQFVRAERIERGTTAPLVATAYHLIDRGKSRAYLTAVRRAAVELKVRASGPFPPYAFAPEVAS
jgi:hypothetical protein